MNRRKPKVWEILFGLVWIALFLLRHPIMAFAAGLPSFWRNLLDMLSGAPTLGIGLCIGMGIRWMIYQSLSPQEQRDEDRKDTDERNVAIRGRAAWFCLYATWIGLVIPVLVLVDRGLMEEAIMFCGAIMVSIIVFGLAVLWFNKRM